MGRPATSAPSRPRAQSDEGGYNLTLQLKQGDANTLQLFRDGALVDQRALAGLNSYTITDTGTNAIPSDFLTVDYTNGFFSLPGGLTFTGDGSSRLILSDPDAAAGQVYTVTSSAVGRNGAADHLQRLVSANRQRRRRRHGSGAWHGPGNGDHTGPGANVVQVAADSGLLGSVLRGPLIVAAGNGANTLAVSEANNNPIGDAVAVTAGQIVGQGPSSFAPGALPFQIDYSGSFAVVGLTTGSNADLVTVVGTSANAAQTNIATGDGDDRIGVTAQTGSLGAALAGPLSIDAGAGNNVLVVSEANNTAGDHIEVTADAIIGESSPFVIGYTASGGTFAGVVLTTGSGADVIDVFSKRADGQLDVGTGGGGDTVRVSVARDSLYSNFYVDGGGDGAALDFTDVSGGAAFRTLPLSASQSIEQASYSPTDVSDIVLLRLRVAADHVKRQSRLCFIGAGPAADGRLLPPFLTPPILPTPRRFH